VRQNFKSRRFGGNFVAMRGGGTQLPLFPPE
jgi:hypothetical protein